MPLRYRLIAPLVLFLMVAPAEAQVVVTGTVTDAGTGEPLATATVQVAGTYTGTITNAAGEYELRVPEPAAELVYRFIGYETARRSVEGGAAVRLDVALQPAAVVGPELVVTDENPAEAIMRRVIERKQQWQAGLDSWQAEAYSRKVLGRDTAIVAIIESVTEAYWKRGAGVREVVRAYRRTENLAESDEGEINADVFSAADAVINLYGDELEFAGYRLLGPTAPGALGFYRFTLEGTRTLDDRVVYDIALRPKNPLQPGFVGRVAVLGGDYAMLEAALRPNEVVRYPFVSDFGLELRQQFSSFGQEGPDAVWLPVDFRLEGQAQIGLPGLRFPLITVRTLGRLSDYRINVPVPDSLFAEDRARLDTTAAADSALVAGVVPLDPAEEEAYARIDTTDTIAEAYRPSGALARFIEFEADGDEASVGGGSRFGVGFVPEVWFNRVEAAHLGGTVSVPLGERLRLTGGAAYSTGLKTATYEAALRARWARRFEASAGYRRAHLPQVPSSLYGRVEPSIAALVGEPDYYDYYRAQGVFAEVAVPVRPLRARVAVRGLLEEHDALRATSAYDLLGRDRALRPNPPVPEGTLRALGLDVRVGDATGGLGASLAGTRGLHLRLEGGRLAADPGDDSDYLRAEGVATWRVPTWLRRRLFPMALTLRLAGGMHAGALPPQRAFAIDGTVLAYAPSGAFRARRGRPYVGDRYAALAWEHDFRSVPFELLGLDALAERQIGLLLHGAHGRAWADAAWPGPRGSDGWHHEVGLSLSGGFFIPARLDLTARLDEPGLFVSFGLARLF